MAALSATDHLIERVHALPLELFDWIKDLVLTPDADSTADITPAYQPPAMLQLNRAVRSKFAKDYYQNTTFRLFHDPADIYCQNYPALLVRWLKSLANLHLLYIRKVHLESPPLESFDPNAAWMPMQMFRSGLTIALIDEHKYFEAQKRRSLHPSATLSTEIWVRREGGTVRERMVSVVGGLGGRGEVY